jgi:UPF0755 protein
MGNNPRNLGRRRRWPLVLFILAVLLGLALAALGYLLALQPVTLEAAPQSGLVSIEPGQGVRQIAAALEQRGLVRHAWAFMIQAYLSGQATKLQAGYYQLSSDMGTEEIVAALATGATAMRKITVPEGYTLEQTAALVEQAGVCSASAFIGAATDAAVEEALGWQLPKQLDPGTGVNLAGTAEGFLFPETYFFPLNEDPAVVVRAMLEQMKRQFIAPLWEPAARQRPWGGLQQVVNLASLVEREARLDQERALIAGVLLNRLHKNMPLQCDATVQYALGDHRDRLTYRDLKVDSPYNTYLHPGLPPSPICSPGLPSLRAALQPQRTDYLFYVARPNGTHVFSRTYQEHLAAIARLRGSD